MASAAAAAVAAPARAAAPSAAPAAAAAAPSPPASSAEVQEALFAPLTLVQKALDAHAAIRQQDARAPMTQAQINELRDHCSHTNWGVEARLSHVLGLAQPRSSPSCLLSRIPSLNSLSAARLFDSSHLRPGQLVRFRGMVQETFEPQFFTGIMQAQEGEHKGEEKKAQAFTTSNLRTGKYRDQLHVSSTGNENHECIFERLSVNVVPVPGESAWVEAAAARVERRVGQAGAAAAASGAAAGSAKKKRGLEVEEPAAAAAAAAAAADAMSDEAAPAPASASAVAAAATPVKKGKSAADTAADGAALPEERGLEVIVTVYDALVRAETAARTGSPAPSNAAAQPSPVRVGDVLEFIGVLSVAPGLKAELEDAAMQDELGEGEWGARRSQALRMHALTAIKVEAGFPLVADPQSNADLFRSQREAFLARIAGARVSLLSYFTSLLCGDELAAEVLLLFLLQRMHTRQAALMGASMIGKLVLNLVLPAPTADKPAAGVEMSKRIQLALEGVMPRLKTLQVNVDTLNAEQWQPKKDYDTDSVEGHRLNLASPSVLLLDESTLTLGRLNEEGVRNLRVLSKLLSQNVLEYDFQYQMLNFPVEYATLLLSVGAKTLLSADGQASVDVTLKVQPGEGSYPPAAPAPTPTEDQFNVWRHYLMINRQTDCTLAPAMGKLVEDWFVSQRQKRPTTTNESTLHQLLNVARLYSLSHGEVELASPTRFNEVTQLFERITQRGSAQA